MRSEFRIPNSEFRIPNSKGLMIASPSYGLANRLRLMGSAKIMADVLAKEFRFIWEQNGDMPDTRWHDLFEPSPEFVELELRGLRGWLTKVLWRSPFAGPSIRRGCPTRSGGPAKIAAVQMVSFSGSPDVRRRSV